MIRTLLISICCVAYVTASTTTTHKPHHTHAHHSRPTHEPIEHDTFKFIYEPHSHKMVLVSGHNCYVFSLTDAERLSVHTDAGIKALEFKLLNALASNAVVTTTKDQLNPKAAHACGGHTTAYYTEASP